MICPRCNKDTALLAQKIAHDGTEAFLCEPCKANWISVSSFFGPAWWKAHKPKRAGNEEFLRLYGLFLKDNDRYGKSERRIFAHAAVAAISEEISRKQALFLPGTEIVTREDFSWVAGVLDGAGKASNPENPGKTVIAAKTHLPVLFRLQELLGGKVHRIPGKDPYFISMGKSAFSARKRIDPYFKCTNEAHPEEVDPQDDRLWAWMAGILDAKGSLKETSDGPGIGFLGECRWLANLFEGLLGGIVITNEGKVTLWEIPFSLAHVLRNRIGLFIVRKEILGRVESAQDPNPAAERPLVRRGEGRAPGMAKASRPERPPAPEPKKAGFNPAGTGGNPAARPGRKGSEPFRFGSEREAGKVRLPGEMFKRARERSKKCFLCRYLCEDPMGPQGELLGSPRQPIRAKLRHLQVEFGFDPSSECPECLEEVPLGAWSESFSMCGFCSKEKEGRVLLDETKGVPL